MADIIKEFNMIDFLGMIIPGSVLMILFGYEFNTWFILNTYFGGDLSSSSKIIIVLICGYVVGMLLHEIGDIAESLLWNNRLLNPRLYAALSSRYLQVYVKEKGIKKSDVNNKRKMPILSGFRYVFLVLSGLPAMGILLCAFCDSHGLGLIVLVLVYLTINAIYIFAFRTVVDLYLKVFGKE